MTRALYAAGWAYVALCGLVLLRPRVAPTAAPHGVVSHPNGTAADWFAGMKPFCNAVEVEVQQKYRRPPEGTEGAGYSAACYALAGKTSLAREVIERLPASERGRAAAIVFAVGHPVADAGDDESAGPIMRLVVEYQPDNYMALYHAGMSEYILGHSDIARAQLERFLEIYRADDGWRSNARTVLDRIEGR
ncbi:MAG TPA: hypothetical protein VEB59_06000 [Gemmatimonadales bacterium]|nr:hypothetical protein [Gemmatimonadales bacterium]